MLTINSITKRLGKVKGKTVVATVDLGKSSNMGYARITDEYGDSHELKQFQFENKKKGFQQFLNKILKFQEKYNGERVIVGIESTGSYGYPLIHYLENEKRIFKLVQVNPFHTKKIKELEGNSPNKTDKKDPKVIADIIELGHSLTVPVPKGVEAELRILTNARERALTRQGQLLNQLESLIAMIFPEYLWIMKGLNSKSSRYLLKNLIEPKKILNTGVLKLSELLKKISHGKLGEKRAKELYAAAEETIEIKENIAGILLEIEELTLALEQCNESIKKFEERLKSKVKEVPYSQYILSMKGVGEITAACIIGEIGDFSHFDNSSELLKFAGLNLYEISSGKHKGERRISKRGRSLLRKFLFFLALNTVKRNGIMYERYQKYIKNGKSKIKSIVAIERRLLRVLFALVRDKSKYIEGYRGDILKKVA